MAIAARPSLRAVLVPAVAPRMRIFHTHELEIFLPVGALFGQRRIAKTGFDPGCNAVVVQARFVHIINVLVPAMEPFPSVPSVIERNRDSDLSVFTFALTR